MESVKAGLLTFLNPKMRQASCRRHPAAGTLPQAPCLINGCPHLEEVKDTNEELEDEIRV